MRDELDLLATMEKSPEKCRWQTPIRHAIPTEFDCTATGETFLTGCGAFYPELKCWYHAQWLPKVVRRTVKLMEKRSPTIISIHCLEQATTLFSCNAVLGATCTSKEQHPPHPKSLIQVDNTTASAWTRKIAASSEIGKTLKKCFAAS